MLYLRYSVARDPTPTLAAQHRSELKGGKMTVETMIKNQTRIETQEHAKCASVSIDRQTANMFQQYVNGTLGFSRMRFGWMYGTVSESQGDEFPTVEVHAIYEPEQEGSPDTFDLRCPNFGEEDGRADLVASCLGLKRVGMIFNVASNEENVRDYTLSAFEVRTMAECQTKYGPAFVTAVVMMLEDEDEDGLVTKRVSIEPFQVSEQCRFLFASGWFHDEPCEDKGSTKLNREVIVVDKYPKDVTVVDNDRFLVPVKILDHVGPLLTEFPVENRIAPVQTTEDVAKRLTSQETAGYARRLRDFHLLLFLSKHLDPMDVRMVAEQAALPDGNIQEGHKILIDSLAGL